MVVGLFGWLAWEHWVPAHGGVDQNGYLVGGKMVAQTGTSKIAPRDPYTGQVDPYQFVGLMWVGIDLGTPTERFYPKYPIGLSVLYAGARLAGGESHGVEWAFVVSPVCMTLAVLATFYLGRMVAGSFGGILAAVLMATSPVTLGLTNNPNSHASTACFVTWGMFFLGRWWQSGGAWRASVGGFLIGVAYTIRYTEGLLVIPIVLVILLAMRWRELRSYVEAGLLLAWWALPVVAMTCFNVKAMGCLTGYDPTGESSGFRWDYLMGDEFFAGNWETLLRQLNHTGLYFFFPLSVLGLLWMWTWNWRIAAWLSGWILPNVIIYAFYYWAPDGHWTGYMRFFHSMFAGLAVCAMWLVVRLGEWMRSQYAPGRVARMLPDVAIGGIVALVILINFRGALASLEGEHRHQLFMRRSMVELVGNGTFPPTIPPGSVVFSHDHLLHQLQFQGEYQLYSPGVFTESSLRQRIRQDPTEAHPLHRQRSQAIVDRLGDNFTQGQLTKAQQKIIDDALARKKRVFFVFAQQTPRIGVTSRQALFNALAPLLPGGGQTYIQQSLDARVVTRWNNDFATAQRREQPRPGIARKRLAEPPMVPPNLQSWVLVEAMPKLPPTTATAP